MICFPNAKINLGLRIIRKRADGYHDLETIFVPVGFCDILEILPAKRNDIFHFSGIPLQSPRKENLVVRAIDILRLNNSVPPVRVHLHKNIPPEAGLGGGSSDAAHTLLLLNHLFHLNLKGDILLGMASKLGSDCAFFIRNRLSTGEGRGELIRKLKPTHGTFFVRIIVPPVRMSTREAFGMISATTSSPSPFKVFKQPPVIWKDLMINDFQDSVIKRHLVIGEILHYFYEQGAVYAALSGSGSAVFGLFSEPVEATGPYKHLPGWVGEVEL